MCNNGFQPREKAGGPARQTGIFKTILPMDEVLVKKITKSLPVLGADA